MYPIEGVGEEFTSKCSTGLKRTLEFSLVQGITGGVVRKLFLPLVLKLHGCNSYVDSHRMTLQAWSLAFRVVTLDTHSTTRRHSVK
jgi:predicted dienelactone hydrolase